MEETKTAYTVQELFDLIKNLPADAEIEINGHLGVDVTFIEKTLCLDHPAIY